ncbi:hypothetical protein AB0F88_17130 [Streptosporangium sp. NPDC023963]|uniref:hypothetical protein n=1 Tax=Streptosporangium sp. NPDC023963 TaxID=3155608 RepID=UPI0034188E73
MSFAHALMHRLEESLYETVGNDLIDLVAAYRQTPRGAERTILAHQIADLADRHLVELPHPCYAVAGIMGEAVDEVGAPMHFAKITVVEHYLARLVRDVPGRPHWIIHRDGRPCYVADCDGCGEVDERATDDGVLTGHHDSQAAADEAAARHWIRTWDGRLLCRCCAAGEFAPDAPYICRHCGAPAAHVESQPAADAPATPIRICQPCLGG